MKDEHSRSIKRLPLFERKIAWLVWIFHSAAAFFISYSVSNGKLRPWINHWLMNSSYVDNHQIDLADAEWSYYRNNVNHLILDFSLNSIGLYMIKKIVPSKYKRMLFIILGLLLQLHMSSLKCITVLYSFAFIVTIHTILFRHQVIPWIFCITFIVKASDYVPFSMGSHIFYREFNVYLYGAIKILSFNLYMCENKHKSYHDLFIENMLYYAYVPYSMTLIVIFNDFCKQYNAWEISNSIENGLRKTLIFGGRLIFWFYLFEMLLHFIYVNAIFNSEFTLINGLNVYEVCAIAYVAGQFFHLKYIIIFGIPSFFAHIDGMRPPPPPICISRVSLYSRMWRHFDNGLYQFLKHHVYIPVMSKPLPLYLSILRNLLAIISVFGVVLAWHGTRRSYLFWVSLSASELIIERIGLFLIKREQIRKICAKLGGIWSTRILAFLMLFTVTPGIFGVFFFLGQEGIGETISKNVVLQGVSDVMSLNLTLRPLSAGFGFLHILTLGYFYNNVCLDLEYFNK